MPKYVYNDELRSVGCYENKYQKMDLSSHYLWENFSSYIKFCFENKSYEEWKIIIDKLNLLGVMVPSHYKLKLKNHFTDKTFTLYY